MNILFPLTQAGSGSDVFTNNLVSGLNNSSIKAEIQYFPKWSGYVPSIMGKLCKSAGYDIIHANSWNGYAFKGLKPILVTAHSAVGLPELKKYQTRSQRLYYKFVSGWEKKSITHADAVCCVSRFSAQCLERMYGFTNTSIIYNGINTDFFYPKNQDGKIPDSSKKENINLFFAGNRRILKGYDLIPRIMKELGDGYKLTLASGLRSSNQVQFSENITDLGHIDPNQMPNIYRDADLFLFPTRLEGFSLSILEAMSSGLPIVATNTASLPEQVVDGKGGVLCPMDDIRAFANAVKYITEDESIRQKMGIFNRSRVLSDFNLTKMVEKYVKIYKQI